MGFSPTESNPGSLKKTITGAINLIPFNIFKPKTSNERSLKAINNIKYSLVLKVFHILINLMYVPVCIDYLDKGKYGIWLTLSSIIGWFGFFDLGLGNGLRNKLAQSIAISDFTKAKKYVSTSYFLFTVIFGGLILISLIVNPFVPWTRILNSDSISPFELKISALIVIVLFLLRFIFQNITFISFAYQDAFLSNLFTVLGNAVGLIFIYVLTMVSTGKFAWLVFALSFSPVFILFLASVWLFNKRYRECSPSYTHVDLSLTRDLLGLGLKFLVISITSVVLFSTGNIIITQLFGPEQVTVYNIAYKYFSVGIMGYAIIMSPIWSAVTDAFAKKDYDWLKNTLKKLNLLSVAFFVLLFVMLAFSNFGYRVWLGERVQIPFLFSLVMFLWAVINVFLSPYSSYINGLGKLSFSIKYAVAVIVIYPVLAILLSKTPLMAVGVMAATCVLNLLSAIFQVYQVNLILNNKAFGIWNK